jgi:putative lipase involved disintegration of autophagic bodies
MIIRNIYTSSLFILVVLATYIISCTTTILSTQSWLLSNNKKQAATEEPAVHPLAFETVSLKSMYHHAPKSDAAPATNSRFYRLEVPPQVQQASTSKLSLKPVYGTAYRPSNMKELFELGKSSLTRWNYMQLGRQLNPTPYILPNVSDHSSVLALGLMSYNAYYEVEKESNWYDMGGKWKIVSRKEAAMRIK